MRHFLAVDFGGTKTTTAYVDESGGMEDRRKQPSPRSVEEAAELVAHRAQGADAAGILVPGIYDAARGMAWAPNLWGPEEVALGEALAARVKIPVTIDADRSGYVLGEHWLGVARGMKDVIFVALGTGIGAGILCDGKLVRGAHGIAGAVGWFALSTYWKPGYLRCGCWEYESAGAAIERGANLDRAAEFTAMAVANLISVFDPEIVVLGGGVMRSQFPMLEEVRRRAKRWAQPMAYARARIEASALGEDAGLYGAARIAI